MGRLIAAARLPSWRQQTNRKDTTSVVKRLKMRCSRRHGQCSEKTKVRGAKKQQLALRTKADKWRRRLQVWGTGGGERPEKTDRCRAGLQAARMQNSIEIWDSIGQRSCDSSTRRLARTGILQLKSPTWLGEVVNYAPAQYYEKKPEGSLLNLCFCAK